MRGGAIEHQESVVTPVGVLAVQLEGKALHECAEDAAVDHAVCYGEVAGSKVVDGHNE